MSLVIDSYRFAVAGGGFSPDDFANLQLWLDAADASTFSYSSGVLVSQWDDKSGNGRHASQGTAADQPSRNGSQNGLTTVVFDGVSSHMSGAVPTTVTDNFTMFVVVDRTGDSSESPNQVVPAFVGSGANGWGPALRANSATKMGWLRGGVAWHASTTDEPVNACILTLQRVSGTATLYLDGSATSPTTGSAPNAPSTRYTIGSHATPPTGAGVGQLNGELCEVLVYSSALSSTDRATVETYLADKWGI